MTFVALPRTLKVGCKLYHVAEKSPTTGGDLGHCDPDRNEIAVVAWDRPDSDVAEVFLHEILHAAWHMAGVHQGDDEERTVSALSRVLAQTFEANPALRRYLDEVYR